jgi:hypothetical protein
MYEYWKGEASEPDANQKHMQMLLDLQFDTSSVSPRSEGNRTASYYKALVPQSIKNKYSTFFGGSIYYTDYSKSMAGLLADYKNHNSNRSEIYFLPSTDPFATKRTTDIQYAILTEVKIQDFKDRIVCTPAQGATQSCINENYQVTSTHELSIIFGNTDIIIPAFSNAPVKKAFGMVFTSFASLFSGEVTIGYSTTESVGSGHCVKPGWCGFLTKRKLTFKYTKGYYLSDYAEYIWKPGNINNIFQNAYYDCYKMDNLHFTQRQVEWKDPEIAVYRGLPYLFEPFLELHTYKN